MNRRKFLTMLGIAPAAGIAKVVATEEPLEPIKVEEWWIQPHTYTSGYCESFDTETTGNSWTIITKT